MFIDTYESLCKQRGVSCSKAAQEMGINKGTVSVWRNKGTRPQAAQLEKIAEYFGVTVDYLLTGEKEKAPGITAESEIEKALAQATPEQRELINGILGMNENQLLFVKELVDKAKKLVE